MGITYRQMARGAGMLANLNPKITLWGKAFNKVFDTKDKYAEVFGGSSVNEQALAKYLTHTKSKSKVNVSPKGNGELITIANNLSQVATQLANYASR